MSGPQRSAQQAEVWVRRQSWLINSQSPRVFRARKKWNNLPSTVGVAMMGISLFVLFLQAFANLLDMIRQDNEGIISVRKLVNEDYFKV